ncbi:hypothetical protein GCM10020220_020670 [Nonomuraea rubra]|uniref:hypothetical protein n=1 Tax=Nonomuraea rubra TaxID=46180 RepID=UPI0031EDF048
MAEESSCVLVRASDVSIDDAGRVTIENPETAQALMALARYTPNRAIQVMSPTTANGGNCSSGCAPK